MAVEELRQVGRGEGGNEGEGEDRSPAGLLAGPQPRPDEAAEQRQRLAQTMARIRALPETLRRVVELRRLRDENTEAVCRALAALAALAISEQNPCVRLHHRARRALAC